MDSNYKRESIIYIIFLMFLLFILFGLPIYLINSYFDKEGFIRQSGIIKLLKQFLKLSIIVLFVSIFIILIFV